MGLRVFSKKLKQLREETQRKQWERAKAIAERAHALSPVDTGQHAASIIMTDNPTDLYDMVDDGAKGGPDICKFKPSPRGKSAVYYIGARVKYGVTLEKGLYTNPGQPHWSPKPIGIVVRTTPSGYMVIRTTDEGFSNRAPEGVIEAAFRELEGDK